MPNKPSPEASIAVLGPDELGEGPVWDDRSNELVRVDISGRLVHRWNPATGEATSFATQGDVSAAVLCEDGGLVLAIECELWHVEPSGQMTLLGDVEPQPGVRFNDCRADPRGRLWAGTLHRDRDHGKAALYRLESNGELTVVLPGRTISNGIGWNPGGATMYYIDSTTQRVVEFDYDLDTGELGQERLFAEIDPVDGLPDGLTVDADGCIWVCLFGGGRIRRYRPDGALDQEIVLPLTNPTCPAFGGADLRTLYITTASVRLPEQALSDAPLSGALFACTPGVSGLPETAFAG